MKNNNFDFLLDLNIEYLKNQLKGEPIIIQKGVKLEEFFNLYIKKERYDGFSLENLNDNITLFNYRKNNPRSFQVNMTGLVKVQENIDDISTNTEETEKTTYKNYKCKFLKFDFWDENETVKLNYENTNIEYDLNKMKFINETKKNINLDLCEFIKNIGKNNAEKSVSNVFERAKSILNNEEKVKSLFKDKYDINELKNYYDELLSFSFILKNRFNHSQKGYPNLVKFSQIKGNDKLYFFHAVFVREMDGAYKVISKYNLSKAAGIYEKIFDEKKKNKEIFVKNDVLLFELKDSKTINYCLNCMYDNYDILNGYVKLLKKKKEFKNCEFYYIGIQEKNEEEEEEKEFKKNKIIEDVLKVKLI